MWNLLNSVSPSAGNLAGRLICFDATVAREHLVVPADFMEQLSKPAHLCVHHCSAYMSHFAGLLYEGFKNFRVNMTLARCPVATDEVHPLPSLNVPHVNSFCSLDRYWQRIVILTNVLFLKFSDLLV